MTADRASLPMRSSDICGVSVGDGSICDDVPEPGRHRCARHRGGAPHGKRNGLFSDGYWSSEAAAERRWAKSVAEGEDSVSDGGAEVVATPAVAKNKRRPPVTLRHRRIDCFTAEPLPPKGNEKEWWLRLQETLGTCSSAFVRATLYHLQSAARMPNGGVSELSVNAALALIDAAKPQDEVEAALAVQMACTHVASMAVLARLGRGVGGDRHYQAIASAAAKLMRTYAIQVEALRRLRHGGEQLIRIERVDIHDGGQAIVGLTSPRGARQNG